MTKPSLPMLQPILISTLRSHFSAAGVFLQYVNMSNNLRYIVPNGYLAREFLHRHYNTKAIKVNDWPYNAQQSAKEVL